MIQSYIKGIFVVTCFTGSFTAFDSSPTPGTNSLEVAFGAADVPLTYGKFLQPQAINTSLCRYEHGSGQDLDQDLRSDY